MLMSRVSEAFQLTNIPKTLPELFLKLKMMKANHNHQTVIFNYVKEIAYNIGLRVHYEKVPTASDSKSGNVNGVQPTTSGFEICRVVLSGDKRKNGMSPAYRSPLFYKCNGLVLDARTWIPLVIPTPPIENFATVSAKFLDGAIANGELEIIHTEDGTIVTLYNWNHPVHGNVWGISTANGYDVSTLQWAGKLTYSEALYSVASRVHPLFVSGVGMSINQSTKLLEFANLDPKYCYTIGFRYHGFHPLSVDPERIWQVCISALSDEVKTPTSATMVLPGIGVQRKYVNTSPQPVTVHKLRDSCNSSLEDAKRIIAVGVSDSKSHTNGLHYGYILRATTNRGEFNYIIESPLLKRIRGLVYNRLHSSTGVNYANRFEYCAMKSFLTMSDQDDFIKLYPNFKPQYQLYNEFTDTVINLVKHSIRQPLIVSRKPTMKSIAGQVAKSIYDHICKERNESLNGFHSSSTDIISNFVINPEYALFFIQAIDCQKTKSSKSTRGNSRIA